MLTNKGISNIMRSAKSPNIVTSSPSVSHAEVVSPIAAHERQQRRIGNTMMGVNASLSEMDDLINSAPDTTSPNVHSQSSVSATDRMDAIDKRLDNIASGLRSRQAKAPAEQAPMQLELFGVDQAVSTGDFGKAKVRFSYYNDADTKEAVPVAAAQASGRDDDNVVPLIPPRRPGLGESLDGSATRSEPDSPLSGEPARATGEPRSGIDRWRDFFPPHPDPDLDAPHRASQDDEPWAMPARSPERNHSTFNLVVGSGVESGEEGKESEYTVMNSRGEGIFGIFSGVSSDAMLRDIEAKLQAGMQNMERLSDYTAMDAMDIALREAVEGTGVQGMAVKIGMGNRMGVVSARTANSNVRLFSHDNDRRSFEDISDFGRLRGVGRGDRLVICTDDFVMSNRGGRVAPDAQDYADNILVAAQRDKTERGVIAIDVAEGDLDDNLDFADGGSADNDNAATADHYSSVRGGLPVLPLSGRAYREPGISDSGRDSSTQTPRQPQRPAGTDQAPTKERKKSRWVRRTLVGAAAVGAILGAGALLSDKGPQGPEVVQVADIEHDGIVTDNEMKPTKPNGDANYPANIVEDQTVVDENQPDKYWTDLNNMVDKAVAGGELEKVHQDNGTWYLRYTGVGSDTMDEYERTTNGTVMKALLAQEGATLKFAPKA